MPPDDECPDCDGTGDHPDIDEDCRKCNGTGMFYVENILRFHDDPDKKKRRKAAEKDLGKKLNEQEPPKSETEKQRDKELEGKEW